METAAFYDSLGKGSSDAYGRLGIYLPDPDVYVFICSIQKRLTGNYVRYSNPKVMSI